MECAKFCKVHTMCTKHCECASVCMRGEEGGYWQNSWGGGVPHNGDLATISIQLITVILLYRDHTEMQTSMLP